MPAMNEAVTTAAPIPQPIPPSFSGTLIQRVRTLIARGQINAATLLLPTIEKLCPDSVAVIKAEIELHRGNLAGAAAAIDGGLAKMPHDGELLLLRARLCLRNRDLVGAALAAADLITAEPGNAGAKSLLGQALLELGQIEQAAICLREALVDLPNDITTLTALTRACPADAEAVLRAIIAEGNASTTMRNCLIGVLLAQKNIEAATAEIRNLTIAGQADAQTGLLAVQAAIDSEDWSQAQLLFNKTTGHLPRHA